VRERLTDEEDDENRDNATLDPVVDGNEVVTSTLTTDELSITRVSTDRKLLVESSEVNERVHEQLNRENDEDVVDVETRVTIIEGEESIHGELSTEVVVFSREHLFSHTGRNLCGEVENRSESEITTLSTLVVLGVLDLSSTFVREHTSVNIFGKMETFLSFRETSSSRHEDCVEEIGVTVVKLPSEVSHTPGGESTESLFFTSSDVSEDSNVLREDVFTSSNDSDRVLGEVLRSIGRVRVLVRNVVILEFTENVTNLEALLEIVVLVRVDELNILSTVEDDGVILIVRFTVSENWVSRKFDAELGTTLTVREDFGVTIDESREDSRFSSFLARTFFVEVGDLKIGVSTEKELGVFDLLLRELGVTLHRNEESELAASHAFEFAFESFGVSSKELDDFGVLDTVHQLDRLRVVHESRDGTVESLSAKGSPDSGTKSVFGSGRLESDSVERNVVGLLVGLFVEICRFLSQDLGVANEVVPFDRVKLLEVFEESDPSVLIFFADNLTKGEKDLFRVVRSEDSEGGHSVDSERFGNGGGERLGEEGDTTSGFGTRREEFGFQTLCRSKGESVKNAT